MEEKKLIPDVENTKEKPKTLLFSPKSEQHGVTTAQDKHNVNQGGWKTWGYGWSDMQ
jgi:hypothetical protein